MKPHPLLPEATTEHLHRRVRRQRLPQRQGTLGQQETLNRSPRGSVGTAPQGQGQLLQQAPLLGGLKLLAGGDGGLEHQQALSGGRRCRRRSGGQLPIELRGHGGEGPQAEQMGGQHHQARQGKPASSGAAATHQAPQAPAHQKLQRRHQTGAAQGCNTGQGRVAGKGGTAQPDPEKGAAGEQHLRQTPEAGGCNRRGGSPGLSPPHQGQPGLHQQAPRHTTGPP